MQLNVELVKQYSRTGKTKILIYITDIVFQEEYRYIYQFMTEYVLAKCARPRIIITGAEGQATNYAFEDPRGHDSYSTDDTASPRSSRSGSFDTAFDDQMEAFLTDHMMTNAHSACISRLSPYMSPKLFASRGSMSSTDSLCGFETASETNNGKCGRAVPDLLLVRNAPFDSERNNNTATSKLSSGQYHNGRTSLPVLAFKPEMSDYG